MDTFYCDSRGRVWPEAPDGVYSPIPREVYEDQLPPMTDAEYAAWFAKSNIDNGVRMGPSPVNPQAEVDQLRKDAARLDYMQQNEITVSCSPACEEPWAVMPRTDDGKPGAMFTGETLRSAIDAAMAGEA